ncbi:MAG: type IX secretion system membrane protein PorP/SprF [Bacteroidetes bacterium]|nr:type IX secretion system membrane protein PorP/SprF [Bacteroidota bacterium]
MKTTTLTTIILVLLSLSAFAQQDAGFSMYFFNPLNVNPGYAGSREVFSGSLVNRSQWVKMPGSPTTQSLSLHSAIPNSRIGLGLQVYNDKSGPMKNTGVDATFAYHLPVNEKTKLSFGVSGMFNNITVGFNEINIDDALDPSFVRNANSSWVPDARAGLYLYKPRFYLGLSANHLLQSRFDLTEATGANFAKFYRQYFLTSGVVLPLTSSVDFRPLVLVKYVNAAPVVGEINGSFIFFQKLFLGAGFRSGKRINLDGTDNMLIGMVEFEITPFLRLGYAYDYYLNRAGTYNSGTHEFMLGWDISGTKTRMSTPRFF